MESAEPNPRRLADTAAAAASNTSGEVKARPVDERVRHVLMELADVRQLLRELDLAAAMLELARIAGDLETRRRNYTHARRSYEAAIALLPQLTPAGEHVREIHSRLAGLKAWLDVLGSRFQSD